MTEPILLCVSGPKTGEMFRDMIRGWDAEAVIHTEMTEKDAFRQLQENTFRIVLIISPLDGMDGYDLAKAAAKTSAGVIFVCRQAQEEVSYRKLHSFGIYIFPTALGRRVFENALEIMDAVHIRLRRDVPQTQMLQDRLRDIRVIGRAKCLLIQYEQMTEEEAHRTIEQQAMHRRMSARAVADEIIESYR